MGARREMVPDTWVFLHGGVKMKQVARKLSMVLICCFIFGACKPGGASIPLPEPSSSAGSASIVESNSDEETATNAKIITVGSYDAELIVTDFFGYETVLTAPPQRVAVLSGTPLNIWYDLGGKSVCSSDISGNIKLQQECRDEMLALPQVGAVYALDMEAVVAQNPDLIITQAGVQSKETDTLRNMGYNVVAVLVRSFEDVIDTYRAFGDILSAQEIATQKIKMLSTERQQLMEMAPDEGKNIVILYLTSSALSVKLDNSIAGDVAGSLNLRNIASGLPPDTIGSENAPLDIEYIVEQNPDIVMVTSMIGSNELAVSTMEKHFQDNQAWQTVPAVLKGEVYYLPQEYFLYNAGPYYNEAVRYMACTVYPEIYGEVMEWYGK